MSCSRILDINNERDTGLLTEYLLEADYIFAKTMPKIPHSYTYIRTWKNKKNFYFCVMAIRTYGYVELFQGNEYTYFNFNNYKYWTMGDAIEKTILINRAEVSIK